MCTVFPHTTEHLIICLCVSLNSSEETSESRGAADARRTFPEEDLHCKLWHRLRLHRCRSMETHKVGTLITEYAFIFTPITSLLPMPCTMEWTLSHTHTSHAKDLLPSGRNRPLKDVETVVDWVEMCQQQLKTTRWQIFTSVVLFAVGVLLPDCWRRCGLGLCGPRQQTLSHPGRGPRWTCGCRWHEGKFEKQKRPHVARVNEEVVYDMKRRCALNVCSPSFELL